MTTPLKGETAKLIMDKGMPWRASPELSAFISMTHSSKELYSVHPIRHSYKEWLFIQSFFEHSKPKNCSIKNAHFIHNPALFKSFEEQLHVLQTQGESHFFSPDWRSEKDKKVLKLRKNVFKRFEAVTKPFNPATLKTDGEKARTLSKVKVLPVWHGTTRAVCESVCRTGFTFFGKHDIIQGKVDTVNTDIGLLRKIFFITIRTFFLAIHFVLALMDIGCINMTVLTAQMKKEITLVLIVCQERNTRAQKKKRPTGFMYSLHLP